MSCDELTVGGCAALMKTGDIMDAPTHLCQFDRIASELCAR